MADIKTSLIYPGIAGYGFQSLGQGMEAGWVSHGLAHLASAAKAQGFQIDLIDLRALSGWEAFRQEPHPAYACGHFFDSISSHTIR